MAPDIPRDYGAYTSIWWGVVTATGSAAITTTHTGSFNMGCQQFTTGAGMTWSADGSGAGTGSATGTASGNYSSLVPAGSGELFVGCMYGAGGTLGGSTSGFTYNNGFETSSQIVYSLSAPNPSSPAWSQSSGAYATADGLLKATGSSPTGGFFLL